MSAGSFFVNSVQERQLFDNHLALDTDPSQKNALSAFVEGLWRPYFLYELIFSAFDTPQEAKSVSLLQAFDKYRYGETHLESPDSISRKAIR